MRILRLKAENFRTLENIDISFNNYYSAICGKNNSGKSNILRAIKFILSSYDLPFILGPENFRISRDINFERDMTNWKIKEPVNIKISTTFEINSFNDLGIYKFLEEFILKNKTEEKIDENCILEVEILWKSIEKNNFISITYKDKVIEDSYQKDEILRKIKSSNCVIFHNSTVSSGYGYLERDLDSIYEFLSEEDKTEIKKRKEELFNQMKNKLKKQQKEFASLLGRLEEKYEVSLSVSESHSFERNSINISLKEKGVDVGLDDWGSGTKNRTLIFLKLLNAKKIKETESSSEKTTPFVIIEEPESFLHPSAQAEFGRVLQDIAEELKIQVIITTHSVYLLNHKQPESNILLDRSIDNSGKIKGTNLINTQGEKWFEPFALTLGINGDDFGPLKDTIFSSKDEIILVEGETDKKYLELLKDERHGENALKFKGEIFAYNGVGNINNNILLRFIKGRFSKFLITIDLDAIGNLRKTFESVGLKENITYLCIGKNEPAKDNIEGLLPAKVLSKVYSENPELVLKATSNIQERKSAQMELKQKLFNEFDNSKEFTEEYFGEFYKLTKKINKIMCKK